MYDLKITEADYERLSANAVLQRDVAEINTRTLYSVRSSTFAIKKNLL